MNCVYKEKNIGYHLFYSPYVNVMATSPSVLSNPSVASSPEVSRSLKEALFETLNGILSPHHDVRIGAEERIQALEVTEGKA
jgi:hypothetical protein